MVGDGPRPPRAPRHGPRPTDGVEYPYARLPVREEHGHARADGLFLARAPRRTGEISQLFTVIGVRGVCQDEIDARCCSEETAREDQVPAPGPTPRGVRTARRARRCPRARCAAGGTV